MKDNMCVCVCCCNDDDILLQLRRDATYADAAAAGTDGGYWISKV